MLEGLDNGPLWNDFFGWVWLILMSVVSSWDRTLPGKPIVRIFMNRISRCSEEVSYSFLVPFCLCHPVACTGEVFWACYTGRRPWSIGRTHWGEPEKLAWEALGTSGRSWWKCWGEEYLGFHSETSPPMTQTSVCSDMQWYATERNYWPKHAWFWTVGRAKFLKIPVP